MVVCWDIKFQNGVFESENFKEIWISLYFRVLMENASKKWY
jgi:hypothetical protein